MRSPRKFTAAGQYAQNCCVSQIVWEGSTTAGDQVIINRIDADEDIEEIWRGRANDAHTYLGIAFNGAGVLCPAGFSVHTLDSGTLLVYLRENL